MECFVACSLLILRVYICSLQSAGMAMNNVAATHRALGRHADALAMFERVLELFRRVLPEDHQFIGEERIWSDTLHLRYWL